MDHRSEFSYLTLTEFREYFISRKVKRHISRVLNFERKIREEIRIGVYKISRFFPNLFFNMKLALTSEL